ncbi:MAG: hypothetical protein ACQERF_06850, partial [Actinomycetota bacterium]
MFRTPRHASVTRADGGVDEGADEGADEGSDGTQRPARFWPRVLGHLVATLVLAAVVLLVLEWAHAFNDPWLDVPGRFATFKLPVLAVSGLAIWGFVALLHAITGRLWLTTGLALAGTAFIAFADFFKMEFRNEPLFPTDAIYLTEAGLLVESVGVARVAALFAGLAVIVAIPWGVSRLLRLLLGRRTTARPPFSGGRALAWRAASGVAAGLVVFAAVTFNQNGNLLR